MNLGINRKTLNFDCDKNPNKPKTHTFNDRSKKTPPTYIAAAEISR